MTSARHLIPCITVCLALAPLAAVAQEPAVAVPVAAPSEVVPSAEALPAPEAPPALDAPPTPVVADLAPAAVVQAEPAPAVTPTLSIAYGKGITIVSPDEMFSMTIRGRMQWRATMFTDPDSDDPPGTEFTTRRARLVVQGDAFEKSWQYYMQLQLPGHDAEPDLRSPMLDAYLTWTDVRDLHVRIGQMMLPQGRHRVISSSAQSLVDRAPVVSELNIDRDVGVQAFSTDLFGLGHRLAYNLGVFGGDGRNRRSEAHGLMYVARLDVTPLGKFEDSGTDADLERGEAPRLAIGVSGSFNQNTSRRRNTVDLPYEAARFDYLTFSTDVMFKWHGFALLTELHLRTADEDSRTNTVDGAPLEEFSRSGWGWMAQAGQMLSEHVEVAGRYSDLKPIDGTDPSLHRTREIAGGLSYYTVGHKFKVQADESYLFGDDAGDGNHLTRVQLEFGF